MKHTGERKYVVSSGLIFAEVNVSLRGNKMSTHLLLAVRMLAMRVGHHVTAFNGFISMIFRALFNISVLLPLFLKCFKIGLRPAAKVTTASTYKMKFQRCV